MRTRSGTTHPARDSGSSRAATEAAGSRGRTLLASLSEAVARLIGRRRGVSEDEFLVFNQELVALLKAGLPIVAGFEILSSGRRTRASGRFSADVREQLVSGVALSDAFLSHGDVFPRLYGTSLKAGERSGEVEKVLRRYLSYQKILAAVRRKVGGSARLPGRPRRPLRRPHRHPHDVRHPEVRRVLRRLRGAAAARDPGRHLHRDRLSRELPPLCGPRRCGAFFFTRWRRTDAGQRAVEPLPAEAPGRRHHPPPVRPCRSSPARPRRSSGRGPRSSGPSRSRQEPSRIAASRTRSGRSFRKSGKGPSSGRASRRPGSSRRSRSR